MDRPLQRGQVSRSAVWQTVNAQKISALLFLTHFLVCLLLINCREPASSSSPAIGTNPQFTTTLWVLFHLSHGMGCKRDWPADAHQYDVHIIAYTSLFRIVNNFHQEVFSDPNVPNRLNRMIDFRAVTLEHDQQLTNYRQEWAERFERNSNHNGSCYVLLSSGKMSRAKER